MLSECGFEKIEVTSFVSPRWVPQMADAAIVLSGITRRNGVTYAALTPNLQGFEAALAASADEIAIFASASEGFSQKNINCSIAQSLERFRPVAEAAREHGVPMRGYVSCVTDCPFDGPTPPDAVADVSNALITMGCYEVSLGDTTGKGTPETIAAMLGRAATRRSARPSRTWRRAGASAASAAAEAARTPRASRASSAAPWRRSALRASSLSWKWASSISAHSEAWEDGLQWRLLEIGLGKKMAGLLAPPGS